MDWLTDLTPFVSDHCWQFVLLASKAPVGVVIRRGPSKWWHLTFWETGQDHFTSGQWFRGSMYPSKCDLAPDGKLFSYFAGKRSLYGHRHSRPFRNSHRDLRMVVLELR